MSISPVGGVGAVPAQPPLTAVNTAGRQAPAVTDADGDSDNSAAPSPAASPGTVNVKA